MPAPGTPNGAGDKSSVASTGTPADSEPASHTRKRCPTQRIGTQLVASEENFESRVKDREKDSATRESIKGDMKKDEICGLFEDRQLDAILERMVYYEFKAGEVVVNEGSVGSMFFITHEGSLEVSVKGKIVNTMGKGNAFGGIALLYDCPRTATVKAVTDSGAWGANGTTFRQVVQENAQKHYAANRKFLDSFRLFHGLTDKQKDRVGEGGVPTVVPAGRRILTEGEDSTAIYCVKKGELQVCKGGTIQANGKLVDGIEVSRFGPGDCFGERTLLHRTKQDSTVVTLTCCELLCISTGGLTDALGGDLASCLEQNIILCCLQKSPKLSEFTLPQQMSIARAVVLKDYSAGLKIEAGLLLLMVVSGHISGMKAGVAINFESGMRCDEEAGIDSLVAGSSGARLGILTKEGLAAALKELGLSAISNGEEASDYTKKMALVKKVRLFRHLSQEQTTKLVKSFVLQRFKKGDGVFKSGEVGSCFYVIATGEVNVQIDGKIVRNIQQNGYFGERALLFDEPRSATVDVCSAEGAELWSIEKTSFLNIVEGKMQQELEHRISLQDTGMTLKDLKQVKVVGAGAAGVVRLVVHKRTGTKYALKRVQKQGGKIPEEVARECALLMEQDHPFIMCLVKNLETKKSVYILTELITGGELHGAIRQIPTVLSRSQSQFYTGSLVIVLEELGQRNIVYRDLKPENVMLDQQGYLKLIDFGIAKRLEDGKSKTFTMVGTPHYMAPEVMRGHGYGIEVDIWSTAIMLFEFVCGYLPFADELDDPTDICKAILKDPLAFPKRYKDEHGRGLMQGMLCRQPKKRTGAGKQSYGELKEHEYFREGHGGALFDKIMGRQLDPPWVPKGETYMDPDDCPPPLSDADELG